MFRSAVFKLTASYVLIVMVICILFSIVLDNVAVHELHTGFYNQYDRLFNAYARLGLRQPGTPDQELALRTHHIFLQIVYFNLFVLVITSVVCYLLARRTLRPIELAHEQQKRFTADVSHELRTPLTALKMETEVVLMDPKAPAKELRHTLSSNLEEVGRMEVLINNLLLLSSMEANKLRTEFSVLNLEDIIRAAIATTRKSAAASKISIAAKLDNKQVRGDAASLTQLFVILLENAIKYSPAGSQVSVEILPGRGRVIVAVQDKGQGIPAADLPHVFDRFYRADSARSKAAGGDAASNNQAQGFGIGLSLAKLIADLHAAEIIITSTPGSGTNVSVILSSKI